MSLMGQVQNVNLPVGEAKVLPSDFGGIVSKAANQTWLNFNSTSSNTALSDADTWQAEQYLEATGTDIQELYPTQADRMDAIKAGGADLVNAADRRKFVNDKLDVLRAENPELFNAVPTFADVEARAADTANKSTEDLMEAQYFTRSNWAGTASFVGGLGGAIADPVNLATMPLGGGGKTVLQLMFREALIGGATELALQPAIMKWQKEIGQEYGLDDAAANVLFGAAGGAGLSGVFRGASVAYAKLANHYIDNEVLNAGFNQLSIDAHLRENDPSSTVYGSKTHLEAVDFGQRALERGFMPDAPTVSRGNEVPFTEMTIGAKAEYAGLDMSIDKRIERAVKQGFDTDRVYYHGTSKNIGAFDLSMEGSSTRSESPISGVWISTDAEFTAKSYADYSAMNARVLDLLEQSHKAEKKGDWDLFESLQDQAEKLESSFADEPRQGQNIIPVFPKGNLKVMDAKGEMFDGVDMYPFIIQAKSEGYDGVKFLNLDDAVGHYDKLADHVMVFDSSGVRSTYDAFDPAQAGSSKLIADDFKEPDMPQPTIDEYFEFDKVLTDNEIFPELRSKDDIGEQLDELDNPDVDAAEVENFDRNVESQGNDVIYMDDGSVMTIRDLQAKFKDDEQMLADITSCSIGGE